ncbi:MAG: triple tyrosine motif-containing protein, partial [Clostridium sp.]
INKGTAFGSSAVQVPVKEIKNGVASLGVTLTGTSSNGVTLNGTLAVVKAKVLKAGDVKFNFTNSDADLSLSGNTVRVKLSNANSGKINYTSANATQKVGNPIDDKLAITSFVTDKASGQPVGTTINMTAQGTPSSTIQYGFMVSNGKTWTVIQNYSSKNTVSWRPTAAGTYTLRVRAINSANTAVPSVYKDITFTVTGSSTNPVITSFVTDKASGQPVGTTINMTAKATPSATAQYAFMVNDGKSWTVIQNYASKNTVAWRPSKAGTYTLRVRVMNSANTAAGSVSKDITFTVGDSSTTQAITSFVTNKVSGQPVGTTITMTAQATPSATAQYAFMVNDGSTWKVLQNYGTSNVCNWRPTKAGTYTLRVRVMNSANTAAGSISKDITFVVK